MKKNELNLRIKYIIIPYLVTIYNEKHIQYLRVHHFLEVNMQSAVVKKSMENISLSEDENNIGS